MNIPSILIWNIDFFVVAMNFNFIYSYWSTPIDGFTKLSSSVKFSIFVDSLSLM